MSDISLNDIQSAFERCGLVQTDSYIISSCVKLSLQYSLTIVEFENQLDAFLCGKGNKFNQDSIRKFEEEIKSHVSKKTKTETKRWKEKKNATQVQTPSNYKKKLENASVRAVTAVVEHDISSIISNPYNAGVSQSQDGVSPSGTTTNAFRNRSYRMEFVAGYNENLSKREEFEPSDRKSLLGLRSDFTENNDDFNNVKQRYRYMYTPLCERSGANEKHFMDMENSLLELVKLTSDDLHPVGIPSQNVVWVCGRIGCEAGAGKMNSTSVVLEGGRDSSYRKVHLDLQIVTSYALFPGQIVLVQGVNSTGRKMVAQRIVEGSPCPGAMSLPSKLLEYHHSSQYQGGRPLQICLAAGPFTTSDNLSYEPLLELFGHALQSKPDVLILIGPFVDITQPILASGEIMLTNENDDGTESQHSASYEMVFIEKVVRDGFKRLFNTEADYGGLPTHIVIVPSLNDAHHEYVFPQPPFGNREGVVTDFFTEKLGQLDIPYSLDSEPNKRVHLLPNPCMFRINEVLFGITSNDILHSLSCDELSLGRTDHRLSRLMGHLIGQQSFSPQFPPSVHASIQVDYRQASHFNLRKTPDILITPSKLTHLAREAAGALVVNPGQLTKGMSGGTFAELTIHPFKQDVLQELKSKDPVAPIPHAVHTRTSVSIIKI